MPKFRDWVAGRSAVTIADNDELYVRDDDANESKRITWGNAKTALAADAAFADLYAPRATTNNRLFVPGRKFLAQSGNAPITVRNAVIEPAHIFYEYLAFPDASTVVHVAPMVILPDYWNTFTIHEVTVNPTTASGDVSLDRRYVPFYGDGEDPDSPSGPTTIFLSAAVKTAAAVDIIQVTQVGGTITNTVGKYFSLYFRRNGAAGGDTHSAAFGLLGFELRAASFT